VTESIYDWPDNPSDDDCWYCEDRTFDGDRVRIIVVKMGGAFGAWAHPLCAEENGAWLRDELDPPWRRT
jgi:hypothetical protein